MTEQTPSRGLALVTGASGGIGSRIAHALAAAGYTLLLQSRAEHSRLRDIERACTAAGVEAFTVRADLSRQSGVVSVSDRARQLVSDGHELTLIVNNAAALLSPAFALTTPNDFDYFFATNVRAPFFLVQSLFPVMPRGASVVNVSSASAHFSSPGDTAYAMSKAALESFTVQAAETLAERGIRINTVVPGFTDNGYELFQNAEALAYMDTFAVLGGVAHPDDVAQAVVFLASPAARRITGTALDVTGGSTIGARRGHQKSVREAT
ncbi:SDR family NAD(P)-dependent oxidoreductase [Leucobacter japonicus]|uniref:SDR family NAD(P)-dependent oxidoreductase n=1 Tax=Leucobacter japonicus TaxID=1461259 RepID=UPI0006A7680F|nr:SDR family oxidoreductase [Leucobacter japonicus]